MSEEWCVYGMHSCNLAMNGYLLSSSAVIRIITVLRRLAASAFASLCAINAPARIFSGPAR